MCYFGRIVWSIILCTIILEKWLLMNNALPWFMIISLSSKSISYNYTKLLIKEGLGDSEIDQINKKIELINSSIFNIGNSILAIAKTFIRN